MVAHPPHTHTFSRTQDFIGPHGKCSPRPLQPPSFSHAFSDLSTSSELEGRLDIAETNVFLTQGKTKPERLCVLVQVFREKSWWPFSECWRIFFFFFCVFFLSRGATKAREVESLSQTPRQAQEPGLPVSQSVQRDKGFMEGEGLLSRGFPQLLRPASPLPRFRVEKRRLREDQPFPGGHGLRP